MTFAVGEVAVTHRLHAESYMQIPHLVRVRNVIQKAFAFAMPLLALILDIARQTVNIAFEIASHCDATQFKVMWKELDSFARAW